MQHGPLHTFQANQSIALVEYASKEEAFKAQKALNGCVLGNTTIIAEFMKNDPPPPPPQQQQQSSGSSMWPQQAQQMPMAGQHGPPMSYRGAGSGMKHDVGTAHWNGANMSGGFHGGGGGMWSSGPASNNLWGPGLLQGDLLGSESM